MAAAAASANAMNQATRKRHEAARRMQEEEHKIFKLMRKYDRSQDGKLDKKEFGDLMQEVNEGVRPSSEEIAYIYQVADREGKGDMDGTLDLEEVKSAIGSWRAYLQNKSQIDEAFKKYDQDGSGKLEFDDLKKLLTDLNDGTPPSDKEVQEVMDKADGKDGQFQGGAIVW
uniref:EF-hand domain-containing protein n=1 Tax=Hanusia phi TaxID=3032 RepID=A0A7S0HT32_9CRYP